MTPVYIDKVAINTLLAKDSTGKLKQAATQRARQVFNDAVIGLQQEFEESPVTQELDLGIGAENISNTLPGSRGAPRNLTAFIGFKEGTNPTKEIRDRLSVRHAQGPKMQPGIKVAGNALRYEFTIDLNPTLKAIYAATPLPWAQGQISWVEEVETGSIRNVAHFLDQFMETKASRSGGGIQVKGEVRPGTSMRPPEGGYVLAMFEHFAQRVRDYARGGLRQRFFNPNTSQPQEPL